MCPCSHCNGKTDYLWPEVKPNQNGTTKGQTTPQGQWSWDGKDWKGQL